MSDVTFSRAISCLHIEFKTIAKDGDTASPNIADFLLNNNVADGPNSTRRF